MGLSALNWGAILGGFGLFMFGIKFMGDGLKAVAGDALRDYINKATSNRFSALLVGIVLTMIMQSSSATSAITIGLVRAGLMTFEQSAGIILGATIGTTITSLLISIEIDRFAMYIIFAGAMLICFGKKPRSKYNGNVILGFALIFFGMASMGDALASLKELPQFESFALKMSDSPLLAMFTGVGLTALVQSSAATIGVVQKLYMAGAVTFAAALPFMFGANIGTTVTGILASIGGTTAGKRTAALHTVLNVISTVLGMFLLVPYAKLIQALFGHLNPMMQIAAANIVFKTLTTLLALPFVTQLTGLVKRIIPGEEEQMQDINIDEMDEEITNVLPSAALLASRRAIDQMIGLVRENSLASLKLLQEKGMSPEKEWLDNTEKNVNKCDQKITDYLIRLSVKPNLTHRNINSVRLQLDVTKNLERVGDLIMNLAEFYVEVNEKGEAFTETAEQEIVAMFDQYMQMFDLATEIFRYKDVDQYHELQRLEEEIDRMELEYRDTHFKRMAFKECTSPVAESVYCDILGTLERMGDHLCNIAKATITRKSSDISDDELLAE
ncbi:MAG: Na/Pi cotransporter family protein [Solobacterium sp.]|nr:Na/Pi cotransporter family protein [Solobacterium sp.]